MTTEGEGGAAEREHLELAHHHPGRLRVRADALIDALDVYQNVRDALDAAPGILAVKFTPQTGSILIEYEPGHADAEALIVLIAEAAGLEPPLDEAELRKRRARPALIAISATRELNKLSEEVTGGRADLRGIVPAALAGFAAYSFIQEKERIPRWDNLLWWSFSVFTMLHRHEIDAAHARDARPITTA